jgi:hypothetical protein
VLEQTAALIDRLASRIEDAMLEAPAGDARFLHLMKEVDRRLGSPFGVYGVEDAELALGGCSAPGDKRDCGPGLIGTCIRAPAGIRRRRAGVPISRRQQHGGHLACVSASPVRAEEGP